MHPAFRLTSTTRSSGSSGLLTHPSAQTGSQLCGLSILTYAVPLRHSLLCNQHWALRWAVTYKVAVRKTKEFLSRIGLKCSIPSKMRVQRRRGFFLFFPFFFFVFPCPLVKANAHHYLFRRPSCLTNTFPCKVYKLLKFIVEPVRFLSSAAASLVEIDTSAVTSLKIICQGFAEE